MTQYRISSIEELLQSGENFNITDVSPDLVTLKIKIHGDQFDSSITGEVAKAIGALQMSLYRAAAEAIHGSPNINSLSSEEKEKLEVIVRISSGCTNIQIPGLKYICAFLDRVTKNMDSKQKCIVACFAISGFTGMVAMPFISHVIENNQNMKSMVEQAKVLANPIAASVKTAGDETAKAAKNATAIDWGEHHYSREDIIRLNNRSARQEAQIDTVSAECRITGFHKSKNIFKIDLMDINTREEFSAKVPPPELLEENMPEKPSEIAALMENGSIISVVICEKETKSKTERILLSWEINRIEEK